MAIFFGMAIFAPVLATHDPSPQAIVAPSYLAPSWLSVFDQNRVPPGECIDDPNFENSPSAFGINGTSGEFSYYHQGLDENHTQSYVNLTWAHTAGTDLDFVGRDPENVMPDCSDFVYFDQVVEWPWNNKPRYVNMSITYATELTGDFANKSLSGNLMFRVYVWVIDSSGNWTRLYESREATYTDIPLEKRISVNYFDIEDIFMGMVSFNRTPQVDPLDQITVRVGLAPRYIFNLGNPSPSDTFNGTVSFKFTALNMVVFGKYFGLLGTTDLGADAWSQLVYGSRISLYVGILATSLSTTVGVIVGMVAGYFGGKVDEILMRVVDFLLVIPGLPLMMVLAAFLGPSIQNIIIVIAILGWTGTSRLIRSQVLAEKNKAYVESARAIGASDTYIMFRHILPNITPILFANITLGVVGAILSEAGLSFLGLTNPEEPSWGRMLADAINGPNFGTSAWWVVLCPGLMITLLSLSFTFVGHTLDQVLNPRLRER